MVKQPTMESPKFLMSSEDFPALPGSDGGACSSGDDGEKTNGNGLWSRLGASQLTTSSSSEKSANLTSSQPCSSGIHVSPDGKITNIPDSMVKDQFGLMGLLTVIRAAGTDSGILSLGLGEDLTGVGLNLNCPDYLYPTFGGPWAQTPLTAQDIDCHVPSHYIINHSIRDKLPQLKMTKFKDDLLFFMYYTCAGDIQQLKAAAELYRREWRYHMEDKIWIKQAPGFRVLEKTPTYERGTYYYFDAQNWRKVAKEFYLEYSKLANQPSIPLYLSL